MKVHLLGSLTSANGTINLPGLEDRELTAEGKTIIETTSFDVRMYVCECV